ncbi:MAG: hypothetical protein ACEPOV_08475 [Hyphomicrobiales bacterium]
MKSKLQFNKTTIAHLSNPNDLSNELILLKKEKTFSHNTCGKAWCDSIPC